jgi:riboflavin transporter FmnP
MVFNKIREEQRRLRAEVKERLIGYILAALGLVAGLAWNEAIKSLINVFFPNPGNDVWIKFLYAFIVTIFIVAISIYLIRWQNKDKEPEKK